MVKLMGILNVTPDSFSDGGKYIEMERALSHAIQMEKEGADLIDIGGESTRPFSEPVDVACELERVIAVITELKTKVKIPLSIDTMKPRVALKAVEAGATLINDVSGFRDPEMVEVAANSDVAICCMHMHGTPKTMQQEPYYEKGIIHHLLSWMEERVNTLLKAGIKEEKIIFDPGLGFGKTVAHNLEIVHNLPKLRNMGFPLLIGSSRKSFLGRVTGKTPEDLLSATLAINAAAILAGVDYIRVHDVSAHRDAIKVLTQLVMSTKYLE